MITNDDEEGQIEQIKLLQLIFRSKMEYLCSFVRMFVRKQSNHNREPTKYYLANFFR